MFQSAIPVSLIHLTRIFLPPLTIIPEAWLPYIRTPKELPMALLIHANPSLLHATVGYVHSSGIEVPIHKTRFLPLPSSTSVWHEINSTTKSTSIKLLHLTNRIHVCCFLKIVIVHAWLRSHCLPKTNQQSSLFFLWNNTAGIQIEGRHTSGVRHIQTPPDIHVRYISSSQVYSSRWSLAYCDI